MPWFPQLYIILNILGAVLCTALGVVSPRWKNNTNSSFQLFIFTVGLWCLISALFFLNQSLDDFWVWNGLLVIPYTILPVFWLNFIAQFTRISIPPLRYWFGIPVATLLIYWIKPLSTLMWTIDRYRIQSGFPIADFERGAWFVWVHSPYSYVLWFAGLGLLGRSYFNAPKQFKESHLILLVVGCVPLSMNGLGYTPLLRDFAFYDLTPLGYTVSSLIFCIATSRYWLLYRSPLVYEAIFTSLKSSILVFDASDRLIDANPAAHQLLNVPSPVSGPSFSQIFSFLSPIDQEEVKRHGQLEVVQGDRNLELSQYSIQDHQTFLGYLVVVQDQTQSRQLEKQLLEGALLYDALTNLPNRTLFQDRLAQATKYFNRHPESTFAVLFLDLDRFKVINDSLGHKAGDQILIEVSQRLVSCLRAHDTVARLGGDEFAILAENITSDEIKRLCHRLQSVVQDPIFVESRKLQTSVSIGVAFSSDQVNPEQILQNADLAMYQTKTKGKAGFTLYDHQLHNQIATSMQLEVDMKNALLKQEFYVEFQPIVVLRTGRITGFEALVRWAHPRQGRVAPIQFIAVAEEIGLIGELDRWVFEQACQQLSVWNQTFANLPLTISINLSVANFTNPHLGMIIADTLDRYRIKGTQLKLEITESLLMKDPDRTAKILSDLKSLGIGIQLDDFGTGHSSLSYLHQLPLDSLKIDQSFVMNADQTLQGAAIIKSIIDLAHNLRLHVIGEGVESEAQRQLLEDLGCEFGQGYFWHPPHSAAGATELVARQQ